jgi:hypothetical protein
MKIEVGTAHVTVVSIPEKGEPWPTYDKVNVPATGDVQQVPLSELIRSAQQKLRGRIETVGLAVSIVCKLLYRLVKIARKSVERWPRYKQKTVRFIAYTYRCMPIIRIIGRKCCTET